MPVAESLLPGHHPVGMDVDLLIVGAGREGGETSVRGLFLAGDLTAGKKGGSIIGAPPPRKT